MRQFKSIFNLLLSLVFIAISFYPCADSYADVTIYQNLESTHVTTVVQQADNNSDHDTCSPLCSCSCCAVSLTVADIITVLNFTPKVENHKTPTYHKDLVIRMEYPIWQPPKIIV